MLPHIVYKLCIAVLFIYTKKTKRSQHGQLKRIARMSGKLPMTAWAQQPISAIAAGDSAVTPPSTGGLLDNIRRCENAVVLRRWTELSKSSCFSGLHNKKKSCLTRSEYTKIPLKSDTKIWRSTEPRPRLSDGQQILVILLSGGKSTCPGLTDKLNFEPCHTTSLWVACVSNWISVAV